MITVDAVLFDLDGTLVDTAPDFVFTVNKQREKHGLPVLDEAEIRTTVSNGARAMINLSFGLDVGDTEFAPLHAELLTMYLNELATRSSVFAGMETVLSQLESKNIPWGIVTNKPRRFTLPLLEALSLDDRSAVTVCPEDVTHSKPDPEPLFLACTTLEANPGTSVYIGDHARDIQAGKNAGMRTIAAAYGYVSDGEVQHWRADYNIDHPLEIIDYLFKEPPHV